MHRGFLLILIILWLPVAALGHNLRVFVTTEGQWITGTTYFAGGGRPQGVRIRVLDSQGQLQAEFSPDAEGAFRWRAENPVDYRIVAETPDGHRAHWDLESTDLQGAFAPHRPAKAAPASPTAGGEPPDAARAEDLQVPKTACDPAVLGAEQQALIERALARQLRPLREQLSRAEDRLLLRDLLGGIGWIFGTAGVAFWWRARSKK